ncbi:MAG: hypothetical protein AAFZ52_12950, partial [Bacteroidota bacterium]
DEAVPAETLAANLEKYYNGLMDIKRHGASPTKATLHRVDGKTLRYAGTVRTFDNFFTQKPLTFHVKAEQVPCPEIGRTVVLFRLSRQGFGGKAWEALEQIKLPKDICRL